MQSTFPSNRGQQGFQRLEVVAVDDHVAAVGARRVDDPLLGHALEHTVGHVPVVVDDLLLAHPVQCGHVRTRPCLS